MVLGVGDTVGTGWVEAWIPGAWGGCGGRWVRWESVVSRGDQVVQGATREVYGEFCVGGRAKHGPRIFWTKLSR